MTIEERIKEINSDTFHTTGDNRSGILWLLGAGQETDYFTSIRDIKRNLLRISSDDKELVLRDFKEIFINEDKLLLKLGYYLEHGLTNNRSMSFGSHPEAKEYFRKQFKETGNRSYEEAKFIRIHLEHLYIDLFKDDLDFKPELLKLVENKKTLGI